MPFVTQSVDAEVQHKFQTLPAKKSQESWIYTANVMNDVYY